LFIFPSKYSEKSKSTNPRNRSVEHHLEPQCKFLNLACQKACLCETSPLQLVLRVDLDNITPVGNTGLMLLQRSVNSLSEFWSAEDLIEFFESAVLGLWQQEVGDGSLNGAPDGEDDISVPSDLLEGNGPDVVVEDGDDVHDKVAESHTLGTDFKVEDLDRVKSLKGSETNRVDCAKDELESKSGTSGGFVGPSGMGKDGGSDTHAEPSDAATNVGEEKQWTTTPSVNKGCTAESEEELLASVTERQVVLRVRVGETCSLEGSCLEI